MMQVCCLFQGNKGGAKLMKFKSYKNMSHNTFKNRWLACPCLYLSQISISSTRSLIRIGKQIVQIWSSWQVVGINTIK